ncbi:DNA-binding protein [Bulleidia sp. zg-1006]|uniref:DNA-binding protein n=1 Tax=Bulleidia sp. zg-1006 TaxID=2806552 RepID=UPI00193A6BA8|nr:DNA-binding protein [Bulleidia sp. zg-1006]QRG87367.1 DNA-binding protein [Bulleidia sp. zg-1006]
MPDKLYYNQLLDFYEELLSDSQQEMVQYYYRQDLSLQEISELEDVSRSAIYDRLKRIRLELDRLEEVLGLYRKKEKRNQVLQEIKKQIDPKIWEKLAQLED